MRACASAVCRAAMRCAASSPAVGTVVRWCCAKAPTSARRSAMRRVRASVSFMPIGSSPSRACQCRSWPVHQPATVGRSCVLVMATEAGDHACGGRNGASGRASSRSNHRMRMPSRPASASCSRRPAGTVPRSSPMTMQRLRHDSSAISRSRSRSGYRRYTPSSARAPSGITHSRISPSTWSMRTPPGTAITARSISRKAAKPCVRIARGLKVVSPQRCPCALNTSGGAPTVRPISRSCCRLHAWLPAPSVPTARSAIRPIAMPASSAARCAAASWRAAAHCRKRWKSTASGWSRAKARTARYDGDR